MSASTSETIWSHSGGPAARSGSGATAASCRAAREACAFWAAVSFGWPAVAVDWPAVVSWSAACWEEAGLVEEPPPVPDRFELLLAAARPLLPDAGRFRERAFEPAIGQRFFSSAVTAGVHALAGWFPVISQMAAVM
jgi:hypothetical protein